MATIEDVRNIQRNRDSVRDDMDELGLGGRYTREHHFELLGRRILRLPGLINFGLERFTTIDCGDDLELRLACQYRTYVITDDPKDLKLINATWTERPERVSGPLLTQDVGLFSGAEELFMFEQTLLTAEIELDIIPDESLVVYKNEPAYMTSISQQE